MFWGLTPALDLQEKCSNSNSKIINILILGGSDNRHILKTIAKKHRHKEVEINFYIMESCMETVARQLLLLMIAFMPQKELGEVQKTRIFMELYGNTIVRPYVARFLTTTAKELLNMVTDNEYLKAVMPFVQLDIKYKERDYLENLIKFWMSEDEFDIFDSWDRRVRKMLGTRYDAKLGAFDWDLHMRYHSIGGRQICTQEYKSFRTNGKAFFWLESEVSKPNRSLVCATIPNGDKYIHYGYLGDIQTGPFVSFGLDCEDDEEFTKSNNGLNKFRATDVTERNLRQIFHELEFDTNYEHKATNDYLMGQIRMQEDDNQIKDISSDNMLTRAKKYNSIESKGFTVKFMSISQLKQMGYKQDFKEFFNLIYCCSTYLRHLDKSALKNIAAKNATLLIENQRFVLSHRDKELEDFGRLVKEALNGVESLSEIVFDPIKENYFEYMFNN